MLIARTIASCQWTRIANPALLLVVMTAMMTAEALADTPGWNIKPDPPKSTIEWPEKLNLSIEQPPQAEELLFPTSPSEFCVAGLKAYESDKASLWNLATGKRMGTISGAPRKALRRALSPDGKYMALVVIDPNAPNDVEVWSMESGKRLSAFSADTPEMSLSVLDFAGPGEVLTYTFGQQNGKFANHMRVWAAEKGMPLRQFDFERHISGVDKYDISPGRNYFATIDFPDVKILNLQTGNVNATIAPPTRTEQDQSVTIESVRFSPDGTEIALLCEGQAALVIAIHDLATGKKKLTRDVTAAQKTSLQHAPSYKGPHVEFVTVPNGFLLYGSGFIERDTGLMIWNYRQDSLEFSHWKRILTPAGLIVSTGKSGTRKLHVKPFPAEKLAQAVEAYRGQGTALVKPGEKVKLSVKVSEVRFGKPADAQKSLETVLAERLAEDGLEVADDGSTVMTVQYKETAGKVLQEFKGGSPLGKGGVATGRSVQSTAGELKIKWTSKDGKTQIYNDVIHLDPSRLTVRETGELTDDKIREQVFAILKIQLAGLPMPYFFPADKSLMPLPMLTTSDMAGPAASAEEALKAKIEAKKKKVAK